MSKFFLPNQYFQPQSEIDQLDINFELMGGGLGDLLCYMTSLVFIAKTYPHVRGNIYTFEFMVPIAENIMQPFKSWRVFDKELLTEQVKQLRTTLNITNRPLNTTGDHGVDIGFKYYLNVNSCPDKSHDVYPKLDLDGVTNPIHPDVDYVVMTVGATHPNRAWGSTAFNAVKDEILHHGLTPVFLGKKNMALTRQITVSPDYDFTGGIDLVDKTSLLEAAKIISQSKAIIGLDNGLLHLAACSSETLPIVFGYNIASPEHRRPRRKGPNPVFDVYPTKSELPCVFCQSSMRMVDHDFKECFYYAKPELDKKCISLLNEPKRWLNALHNALNFHKSLAV